jgi:hypothetical protein
MRRVFWLMLFGLMAGSTALAGTGRIYKVLPQFLDEQGRASLTPSLYDRDAYQAYLRRNPGKISGLQFAVQWKAAGSTSTQLKLRVDLRGVAQGDLPKQKVLELPVRQTSSFSHWVYLKLEGDDYRKFGEVTAWRVSLWDGDQLLGEQKSFLWQN